MVVMSFKNDARPEPVANPCVEGHHSGFASCLERLMSQRCGFSVVVLSSFAVAIGAAAFAEAPADSAAAPFLIEGIGAHRRPVTTSDTQAQRYFDQGLAILYAFNHDEAIKSFRQAAKLDSECAMAWWGVSLALGPHINNPAMPPEKSKAAWEALQRAKDLAPKAGEVERDLIEALSTRYADPAPEDRRPLDEAYAAAMEQLSQKYPQDVDIGALYAESLMDLRPWDLWSADGEPRPETPKVQAALEAVMQLSPSHPLATHLYIHACEASRNPEKADAAAERLRTACPDLGHLVHMPSHIDIRRGRWGEAIAANERAIVADDNYNRRRPEQGFYRIYMSHNHHMLAFAALMRGESKRSLDQVRTMLAAIPDSWLNADAMNPMIVDGYYALPVEILMRFGRWDEVLAEPKPPQRAPVATALWHAARGIAYAAKKEIAKARAEQAAFRDAAAAIPKEAVIGNNPASAVFAVADHFLDGEILLQDGKIDEGLARLREAVKAEDALRYDEPPDWLMPVRHSLGTWLIQAGKPAEAETAYREDLVRWPKNGWSLFGLASSLDAQGKTDAAAEVRKEFEQVWKQADVKLTSSCFCRQAQ
jgi:tetratricopeptide (TPR) repeat protein